MVQKKSHQDELVAITKNYTTKNTPKGAYAPPEHRKLSQRKETYMGKDITTAEETQEAPKIEPQPINSSETEAKLEGVQDNIYNGESPATAEVKTNPPQQEKKDDHQEQEPETFDQLVDGNLEEKRSLEKAISKHGCETLEDFLKADLPTGDIEKLKAFSALKQKVKDFLALDPDDCLKNEELIENVKNNPGNQKPVLKVIERFVRMEQSGDIVGAQDLKENLKTKGKIAAKIIDQLIVRCSPTKKKINTELPCRILGYNTERKILFWHKGHLMPIAGSQIRKEDLHLLVGKEYEFEDLKDQIITEARRNGIISESKPIKSGIWFFKKNNSKLIVSGKKFASIDNGKFNILDGPVFNNRIIRGEEKGWIDIDSIKLDVDVNGLKEAFEKTLKYVSYWNWAHEGMEEYVAALVMLAPFQQAMTYRPWVYLTGPTNCGKSLFLKEVIESIYGELVKRMDKSTAHAIAQGIGGSARILLLDEFEKSKHIERILEYCKQMNRGGAVTSGTPGENEHSFELHHIPWFASIYSPRTFEKDASQRNRIIRMELNQMEREEDIPLFSSEEGKKLCVNIISSVFSQWDLINSKISSVKTNSREFFKKLGKRPDSRIIDNFLYVCALLSVVKDTPYCVPEWALYEDIDDGQIIIQTIFTCKIRCKDMYGAPYECRICDLVNVALGEAIDTSHDVSSKEAILTLRNNGMTIVNPKKRISDPYKVYLGVDPDQVRRSLLKNDDDFKNLDISSPLERIKGAKKNVSTRFGGSDTALTKAIQIPISSLSSVL